MKRPLISLTIIFFAVVFSLGQDRADKWMAPARAAAKKNPVAANETSIALGRKIYERQCLACHGQRGKGDGPAAAHLEKRPGNLANPKLWEQSDGALFWKVNEGHRPMPTFKNVMSDEERWPVINYIRTLAPKPAASDQPKKESKP
jgi:mono/diheme cytochrome c family protein